MSEQREERQSASSSQRMNYPVSFFLNVDMFRNIAEKYCPLAKGKRAADFPKGYTIGQLLADNHVDQDALQRMAAEIHEVMASFEEIQRREAQAFDPNVDLSDDHYLWNTPENREKCVRSIERRYAGRRGEIVFYGPSNITLWYSLEKDMLPYRAQNHGMGGCTDADLMHYADRLLYSFAPTAVFFQTGSNDLAGGITLEQVLENKKKMYGTFLENMKDTQLVVMSGLPLPGRTEFWDATQKTNEYLKKLCEGNARLHFMDATDMMLTDHGDPSLQAGDGRYFNPEYFRIDRIHLNVKGHQVWTSLMKKELETLGIAPAKA